MSKVHKQIKDYRLSTCFSLMPFQQAVLSTMRLSPQAKFGFPLRCERPVGQPRLPPRAQPL